MDCEETRIHRWGAWTLTILQDHAGEADAWLVGPSTGRKLYGRHFDGILADLDRLGCEPGLRFDHAERPYVVWPCGSSALVWRCAQDAELWMSPGMARCQARSP